MLRFVGVVSLTPSKSKILDGDCAQLFHSTPAKINGDSQNPLTHREQEILALIAAGKNNQEIAELLHIATGTVRVHVHAILQKLEVRDRLCL